MSVFCTTGCTKIHHVAYSTTLVMWLFDCVSFWVLSFELHHLSHSCWKVPLPDEDDRFGWISSCVKLLERLALLKHLIYVVLYEGTPALSLQKLIEFADASVYDVHIVTRGWFLLVARQLCKWRCNSWPISCGEWHASLQIPIYVWVPWRLWLRICWQKAFHHYYASPVVESKDYHHWCQFCNGCTGVRVHQ